MELKKQVFQKMKMRSTLLPCCLQKPALGWFFDLDSGFELVTLALLLLYDSFNFLIKIMIDRLTCSMHIKVFHK